MALSAVANETDTSVEKGNVASNTSPPSPTVQLKAWQEEFNNLDEKIRLEYIKKFSEAERLLIQKKVVACLRVLEDIEKLYNGNPGLFNIKGTCYIEIKDADAALACFNKASAIDPNNLAICFNIAETYFIKHDYKQSEKAFKSVLGKNNILKNQAIMGLINFKIYICLLKQNKTDEAQKLEALFGPNDDLPYYYCMQSVKNFHAGNKEKGQEYYRAAIKIYQKSGMLDPYTDAMQETSYLPSLGNQTILPQPNGNQ